MTTRITLMLVLIVVVVERSNSAPAASPSSSIKTSGGGGGELTPNQLIDAFLHKCLHSISIDLDCQPCMLCQNGAFCQQKPKAASKPAFADMIRTHLLAHRHFTDAQHYSILKPKLDFSDLTCYCVPGYTGTYCQIDINECLSQPCSNNSTCVDGINSYECRCPPGYTGQACDIDINECDSSPCSTPGGKCVDLVDGYYCQCSPGYTGPSCAIDIDECHSSPCLHNSTCVDLVNGFECNCTDTGYEGVLCEHNIDDCAQVKCEHGAACLDGVKSYKCECHNGYEGRLCEIDLNECESQPCLYGGICWQNSDPSSQARRMQVFGGVGASAVSNGRRNHSSTVPTAAASSVDLNTFEFDFTRAAGYWCECEPGYTGANCEIKINECESSPCGSNGQCIDLINAYKCVCFNGYTGAQCSDNIDECTLYKPCAPQTKCVDLKPDYSPLLLNQTTESEPATAPHLDGYYCDCTSLNEDVFKSTGNHDLIYAGINCTIKLNACATLKHMCKHGSECQSILASSTGLASTNNTGQEQQDIQCICKPGYTGKYCQYVTTFRMDASYSVQYALAAKSSSLFHLKFDFRVNFFNRYRGLPLVYLKDETNALVVEIELSRAAMRVSNPLLGIDEYVGFFYASPSAIRPSTTNEEEEEEQTYDELDTWSTIEIFAIDARSLRLVYSVKQFHLTVSKVIALGNNRTHIPSKFVLGKRYSMDAMTDSDLVRPGVYTSEPYLLNSACIRDLMLNGEQLFKSEAADNVNGELDSVQVKFGCNHDANTNTNQCSSGGAKNTTTTTTAANICLHNSTCLNKWFDYDCLNCSLPYYGKNCQYESTKWVFLKRVTDNELKSSIELKPPPQAPNSPPPSQFQISFYLHRISTPETQQSQLNSPTTKPNLAFLLLKPTIKPASFQPPFITGPIYQYIVSIESDGLLTLKKIQLAETSPSLDQPPSPSPPQQQQSIRPMTTNYKVIWTLKNEKVNLNEAQGYAAEISIKLAEPNLVEMAINRTHVARFELVNEITTTLSSQSSAVYHHMWDISSVKLRNFNRFVYPATMSMSNAFFFNSPSPAATSYQNGFVVYDLQINGVYYVLRSKSAGNNLIELVLLDERLNFMQAFESTVNSIGLINRTVDDFELIDRLNQDENYCDGNSIAQANYDLRSRGNSSAVTANRNRICFQSEHFTLVEIQRHYLASMLSPPSSSSSSTKKSSSAYIDKSSANTNAFASSMQQQQQQQQPGVVVNVTCDLTTRDDNFYMVSTELRKFPRNFHSTCEKYAAIKKHLLHGHTGSNGAAKRPLQPLSYVNYYFDFESPQNRIAPIPSKVNNRSSSSSAQTKFGGPPGPKLIPLEWDQEADVFRSTNQQKRVIVYQQDVEFYSIAFDLNLEPSKPRYDPFMNMGLNESASSGGASSQEPLRANLFSLNTFDDLTTNRIFLFGLNLLVNPRTFKLDLELFTNKHTLRTTGADLNYVLNSRGGGGIASRTSMHLNLTFTFNSIELRVNSDENYSLRLTDRYFALFFRSLLKAYGSFQMNMTAFESDNVAGSTHLINACVANVRLATRKPAALQNTYQLAYYNLIEQTKSISFFQSEYYSDLAFDQSCSTSSSSSSSSINNAAYSYKYGPRLISPSSSSSSSVNEDDKTCYTVTKVDVLSSQKIDEYLDCECSNSSTCKWSNFTSKSLAAVVNEDFLPITWTCAQSTGFACFNNATCLDVSLSPTQSFTCQCVGSYTGDRCERFDPCINNPCSVNSTCLPQELPNGEITYECKCHTGFLGRNCTIKFDETCLAAPCQNGATCLNVTSLDEPQKLSYECMCTVGYEGKHCETRIDYCKLYEPCKNGATCTNQLNVTASNNAPPLTASSFYKCQCAKGWKGPNCTQDIDECAQMQAKSLVACSAHGQCVNTMGSHKCVCDEFHYGAQCEHTHICRQTHQAQPCRNGGSCEVVGDSVADNLYECKCAFGYAGMNCTHVTCDLDPCEHGSTCQMRTSTEYACNCTGTGYAGVRCENRINEFECRQEACFGNQTCHPLRCDCDSINCDEFYQQLKSKPREIIYHLILWPLLAIMVTLLIILFSIFGMKIKKSRATRGTYSPSRHEQQASRIEFSMDLKIPPEERLI